MNGIRSGSAGRAGVRALAFTVVMVTLATGSGRAASAADPAAATAPEAPSIFERYRPVIQGAFGETSLGAYGEFIYNNDLEGDRDQIEARRFVLYVAHEFNDWVSLYSELEIEHADEIELEQAFIEFRPWQDLAVIRGGVILVPLSFTNLYHEPTYYYSVERPELDRVMVPTTFWEAGGSISGRPLDWFDYEFALHSSLALADRTGSLKTGAIETEGIRGLRQNASRSTINDLAVSGRVTVRPTLGLAVAASFFTGETGQSQKVDVDEEALTLPEARVTVLESDARYEVAGFDFRGQVVYTLFGDAAEVSEIAGQTVGERQLGFHGEASYDLLRFVTDTEQALRLYYRYSWIDLQHEVPAGFESNPAGTYTQHAVGLAWFPIDQVVVKLDLEAKEDDANRAVERLNAGLGFSF